MLILGMALSLGLSSFPCQAAQTYAPIENGAREIPPPKKMVNFLSLLLPELNKTEAAPLREELLSLIGKDSGLARKMAYLMRRYYDPEMGILNANGMLVAKAIEKSSNRQSPPKTAAEVLSKISEASPFLEQNQPFTGGPIPKIGQIDVETKNVFDLGVSGENWWLFRLANAVHIPTKEKVVRRQLLVKPGDPYNALQLKESERNLRALPFLKKAEIIPVPKGKDQMDLKVKTQDAWTTQIDLGFGTQGGQRSFNAGALEQNLLGRGKTIGFEWSRVGDVIQKELRGVDPNLLGSGIRLISLYADTNMGQQKGLDLYKPFYSLRSPNSYSLTHVWEQYMAHLFDKGEQTSEFSQSRRFEQAGYGFKLDQNDDEAHRLNLLYRNEEILFGHTDKTTAGTLPKNRTMSGPLAGYTWTQAKYVEESNINKMGRTEDFNLGHQLGVQAGYMPTALGSDKNRVLLEASETKGISGGPGFFAIGVAGVRGRVAEGAVENGLLFANMTVFKKYASRYPQTLAMHLEAAAGQNMDGENQLRLGGDTGLRGYRNDMLTGNKSVLANLEWRVAHPKEFFHLLYMGAAVFADGGSVARPGVDIVNSQLKSDVGAGLRFSPSRASIANVVRLDFAKALNRGPGVPPWVVSLVSRQAFDFSNNTIRHLLGDAASNLREEDSAIRNYRRSQR